MTFTSDRDSNAEIYLMDADGKNQVNVTNHPDGDFTASLSPDGTKIAFGSYQGSWPEVFTINSSGTARTRLTDNPNYPDSMPVWSPDGSKIAFFNGFFSIPPHSHPFYISTMDPDGNNAVTNIGLDTWINKFSWSLDGMKVTFDGYYLASNYDIFIVDFDGTSIVNLSNHPSWDYHPDFSPNGLRIAFASDRDGNWEIYVMDADGSNQTRLTNNSADDLFPCWSPDGQYIAFSTTRDGNSEIYRMKADGSEPVNLTKNPAEDWYPSWR